MLNGYPSLLKAYIEDVRKALDKVEQEAARLNCENIETHSQIETESPWELDEPDEKAKQVRQTPEEYKAIPDDEGWTNDYTPYVFKSKLTEEQQALKKLFSFRERRLAKVFFAENRGDP